MGMDASALLVLARGAEQLDKALDALEITVQNDTPGWLLLVSYG